MGHTQFSIRMKAKLICHLISLYEYQILHVHIAVSYTDILLHFTSLKHKDTQKWNAIYNQFSRCYILILKKKKKIKSKFWVVFIHLKIRIILKRVFLSSNEEYATYLIYLPSSEGALTSKYDLFFPSRFLWTKDLMSLLENFHLNKGHCPLCSPRFVEFKVDF